MFNLKPSLDDLIKTSLRSILKSKSRTFLTSLGIIIGVTSVILLTSIGNGLQSYITQQFDALGANSIFIAPGKIFNDKGGFNNSSSGRLLTTKFTLTDVSELRHRFRNDTIIPISVASVDVKSGKVTKSDISLAGSDFRFGEAVDRVPSAGHGRWFTKEEDDKKTPVVVLGYSIARDLFPIANPLGRKIIVKGKTLKVIGIVDKKGSTMGGPDTDNQIYASNGIVFEINGKQDLTEIMVKTPTKDSVAPTKEALNKFMLTKYNKDAFSVFDSSQLLNSINAIIGTLTVALSGIAAISLVVGGIGIMNIMLVTVSERTREIGLRKAIGAYPRAILVQFLIEAIILSSIGGITGILFGTLGTLAINNFFPAKITLTSILLAFGVSAAVGIIFGVAPARRASKLSPIEALRYE